MSTYTNPILPGFNPDPSIIRVNNDFFCVTSSFEYFPGAPIYHSTDLIRWSLIGHALTRKSQLDIKTPEPGGGIWATTLRHHNGVFYIITNAFDRYRPQADDRVWPRGFYVRTTDIWDSASWSDPVYFDQVGFDFDVFWDDDGTVFLSSTYRKVDRDPGSPLKDFAIHVSTVELATGRLTKPPRLVRESASGVAEGSHLLKRKGWYYLFTAEGGTESGHCEYVHRSRESPFGPWEAAPHNPVWRNTQDDEVQNTGHCDLVEDAQGQWWAVCLGVRPRREGEHWRTSVFGREALLLPVRWEDDWPVFNEGRPVALQMAVPNANVYVLDEEKGWKADFSTEELGLGWYRKSTHIHRLCMHLHRILISHRYTHQQRLLADSSTWKTDAIRRPLHALHARLAHALPPKTDTLARHLGNPTRLPARVPTRRSRHRGVLELPLLRQHRDPGSRNRQQPKHENCPLHAAREHRPGCGENYPGHGRRQVCRGVHADELPLWLPGGG